MSNDAKGQNDSGPVLCVIIAITLWWFIANPVWWVISRIDDVLYFLYELFVVIFILIPIDIIKGLLP